MMRKQKKMKTAKKQAGSKPAFGKKPKLPKQSNHFKDADIIGDKLPFSAAEAYKLLRTNLDFSITKESRCKIFGFISALPGEGKTTTAVNTAYTIAQTGQKVLLVEADLRLPTVAKKLHVASRPGLSNCLVGSAKCTEVIQSTELNHNLFVLAAGDLPPNPAELLDSKQMKDILDTLSETFDTIIIDMPPIGVVTDGLILSRMVDGMILVVRENYCEKGALDDTVRKLNFAGAKVLGLVMSAAGAGDSGKSGKYGRYSKYGKSGGYYGQK